MSEASDSGLVVEEVVAPIAPSATWKETWINVIAPALFGLIVASIWQWKVKSMLPWGLPNPIQGALLMMLLFSPLFHYALTDQPMKRWTEYALGVAVLGGFFVVVWLMGVGGFVCGGYLAAIVWVAISTSWWRFHLPPFRSALWHTLGVNMGAFGGAFLAFAIVG